MCGADFRAAFSTSFRTGTTLSPVRMRDDPAWYHHKAVFYCIVPLIEVMVVILFAASRVDQRFYVEKMGKDVIEIRAKEEVGRDSEESVV